MSDKLRKVYSYYSKALFYTPEAILAVLSQQKKMKILFSLKPAWEKNIRKGFRFTKHELKFDSFTDENIKNSDMVVPLSITELRKVNQKRNLIENNPLPIPSLAAINICDDKYLFYQALKDKGFESSMPKIGTNLRLPFILKKKVAEDGEDIYIVFNAGDKIKYKSMIDSPEYFCQEIIQGLTEYVTHIIFKNGKMVVSMNIEYRFSSKTPIKNKDKIVCKTICRCPHLELLSSILKAIKYEGLCCFNYKEIDSVPYILEINPRFSGSLGPYFFSFVRHL